jgi:putative two-component system response regulator
MMGSEDELTAASILLVDAEPESRHSTEIHLRQAGFYNLELIGTPELAIDAYVRSRPDLLLLNHASQGMKLLADLRTLDDDGIHPPVIMITGSVKTEEKHAALQAGVADFLDQKSDSFELVLRVKNVLRSYQLLQQVQRQKTWLEETVRQRTQELRQSRMDVLGRLASALEFRDDATGAHTRHVGELSAQLAAHLGSSLEFAQLIRTAALLHDLGKIAVPDAILLKPGQLNKRERERMKNHVLVGAEILAGSGDPILSMASEIALSHHEWWDGTGYPHGLKGTEIPLSGRIVAAVDAYDVMLTDRPYRKALTHNEAVAELVAGRGTQFDPRVVDALLSIVRNSEPDPLSSRV